MATAQPTPRTTEIRQEVIQTVVEAAPEELNQGKRGFTPQAEIWNGRMAMLGLSIGLSVLLIARLAGKA